MRKFTKILLVGFAIFLAQATIFAQTPTGSLVGTVSGPDGVIPGATVQVTYDLTGRTVTATTGSNGDFAFAQLEPGSYTVSISAPGFASFTAREVRVEVGREYNISPSLGVGGIEAEVTVVAGADIVTSTSGQVSSTISTQQILSFPLLTRNPMDLVTSQAGVTSSPGNQPSINGMRTSLTNITRD